MKSGKCDTISYFWYKKRNLIKRCDTISKPSICYYVTRSNFLYLFHFFQNCDTIAACRATLIKAQLLIPFHCFDFCFFSVDFITLIPQFYRSNQMKFISEIVRIVHLLFIYMFVQHYIYYNGCTVHTARC